MYFLKHLPGLFAEGEALPAREHAVLHRFSSQPTSFPFSLTLAAFSVRFHLCLQILFSREAELRQLVLQVVLALPLLPFPGWASLLPLLFQAWEYPPPPFFPEWEFLLPHLFPVKEYLLPHLLLLLLPVWGFHLL